jgi:hypothetical protein
MYISAALIPDAQKIQNVSMMGTAELMRFDENGNINY